MPKFEKFSGQYAAGYERGLPDDVKEWIDDKVYGAGKSMYRGLLQLLASGFGKGAMVSATLLTVGIVAATVAGISIPVAGAVTGATVAQSVETGLIAAGNYLFGHGAALLAAGGIVGAVTETQREYAKMNADMANEQAKHYAALRTQTFSSAAPEQCKVPGQENQMSHCAQLKERRMAEQQAQRGGIA